MLFEMVPHLLIPIVVSWSAAISACEKVESWETALGLLREMVRHLLQHVLMTPNVVS